MKFVIAAAIVVVASATTSAPVTSAPVTSAPVTAAPVTAVTCIAASPGVEYVGTPTRVISAVGSAEACCDVCLVKGCLAWTVRFASLRATCSLYNTTNAIAATSTLVASGHMPGIPTHYMDPYTHASCLPGEINLTVATLTGRWCSAACGNSTSCPLDTPDNVNATPSCEIHDPVGTGKHCALTCTSDDQCGPTSASVCDTTFTPGICTYVVPLTPTPSPTPPVPTPPSPSPPASKCPCGKPTNCDINPSAKWPKEATCSNGASKCSCDGCYIEKECGPVPPGPTPPVPAPPVPTLPGPTPPASANFTFVGYGRCERHNTTGTQGPFAYLTGVYKAVETRPKCKQTCAEEPACAAYWFYTGPPFTSCVLDGYSANDTAAMVAALGSEWSAQGVDPSDPNFKNYCQANCSIGGTDNNGFGGHAECFKKVSSAAASSPSPPLEADEVIMCPCVDGDAAQKWHLSHVATGAETVIYQQKSTNPNSTSSCLTYNANKTLVVAPCSVRTAPETDRWTFAGAVLPNLQWQGGDSEQKQCLRPWRAEPKVGLRLTHAPCDGTSSGEFWLYNTDASDPSSIANPQYALCLSTAGEQC